MAAVMQTGSSTATTIPLETLLNFCRTVVRCDETQLQLAMREYAHFLAAEQQRRMAA